jgi:hypothetical protein
MRGNLIIAHIVKHSLCVCVGIFLKIEDCEEGLSYFLVNIAIQCTLTLSDGDNEYSMTTMNSFE